MRKRITIRKVNLNVNNLFEVTVASDTETKHKVTVEKEYCNKLTAGRITCEELILKSFEFLLEREPNTSILREFNLEIINSYFPEYETTMRTQYANSHKDRY